MGRGVSYGGGQSSLGYLFGADEPSKGNASGTSGPGTQPTAAPAAKETPENQSTAKVTPENAVPEIAAGQLGNNPNNYHRADGQNTGNFITDRPSTKVHSAPGGGSSLGYLFGGQG
ncbi:hypothetical protein KP509_14G075300 [Ceratopteris richardii]|uniref:Uncharacterized protein n=1 Tax=Ceratopteris richardii TaxID=49495 RepID=A0A8T2T9B7_CERRI|nr:hypothetical protein KP509_14G075300 [Ceratopteris richardii]